MSKNIDMPIATNNPTLEPIDSIITVSISVNKLEASVNISPPENGGIGPNVLSLRTSLASKNITYGVDNKRLLNICSNPPYNRNIVIAQGVKPINGINGTYNLLFDANKDTKPKVKEDGRVDFHNLELVENVKMNQVLCEITLPTEGKDGITVIGTKIPCINGKPVPSLLGNNTKLIDDNTKIISTIDGQVELLNEKINVNETLFIKENIDNSTGNLKVAGNIIVNGSVQPGFIIEAKGNIQVNGSISGASLVAGGNIILQNGVIGGSLYCQGDLTSRFIENCNVFSKGNIKADYIMNSNIKCGKSIHTVSSISKIVGGNYIVGENLVANFIGSPAGIKTYIEMGTDSNIIERQQELIKEIPNFETKLGSLKSLIYLLRQYEAANRLTLDKKQVLDDAVFSYNQIESIITASKEELNQISDSIKKKGYGKIICTNTIYPGTTVKIGSWGMSINEDLVGKSLSYSDEGICIGIVK